MIYKLMEKIPEIGENNYIAPTASIIGDVKTKKDVSIWFNAVLRGDNGSIVIGDKSNVQDNVIMHSNEGGNVIIGMNALITDNVIIPKNCFVYADSVVTARIGKIEEGSFIKGNPVKCIGEISKKQKEAVESACEEYPKLKEQYLNNFIKYK